MAKHGWSLEEGGNFERKKRGRRKRKVRERRRWKKGSRKKERSSRGGGPSKPGLGKIWSLSMAVTTALTPGSTRCDLLKCKQKQRMWALWAVMELVITYSVCVCTRVSTDLLIQP